MEEIIETKTVDSLTKDSVSILTQKFYDGQKLGDNHRTAYVNSADGRKIISENEPEDVVTSVFAIWGDTPTLIPKEETENIESED